MSPCSRLQQRMRPLPVWKCEDISETKECSVEFGSIEIREYSRELGVYSDLKNGLALGWDYEQHAPVPVTEYEKEDKSKPTPPPKGGLKKALIKRLKRSSSEEEELPCLGMCPTTTSERQKILAGFGYSKEEIEKAEEERLRKLGYSSSNVTKMPRFVRKVQRICALGNRC